MVETPKYEARHIEPPLDIFVVGRGIYYHEERGGGAGLEFDEPLGWPLVIAAQEPALRDYIERTLAPQTEPSTRKALNIREPLQWKWSIGRPWGNQYSSRAGNIEYTIGYNQDDIPDRLNVVLLPSN